MLKITTQPTLRPDYLLSFQQISSYTFRFNADNGVRLSVEAFSDHIIRLRYGWQSLEPDFSYAIDPRFEKDVQEFTFREKDAFVVISTAAMDCKIRKKDLSATFLDKAGNILNEDAGHITFKARKDGFAPQIQKKIQPGEYFTGLGDKAADLNLRGKAFEIFGTDAYRYNTGTDPLYKNIPFYIGMHRQRAYGILFDNSYRSIFDFGKKKSDRLNMRAKGGEMNYYFIQGPEMQKVVERYTTLTGKPELPPLWALGYHQCKWSYYPENKVREIVKGFRSRNIPCDVIYLDIDYMDGFRCFTWDKVHFPHPEKMIADLRNAGFKTVVIVDPGIKADKKYGVYQEGMAKDYFCKRANGKYMKGKVWPGPCHFPDFTRPEVRNWWAGWVHKLVQQGVAGIWNDMNEPATFDFKSHTFPNDVQFDYEGNPCSHEKAHNVYGMQMARATQEGLRHFAYPKRPFVITRSGYAGLQRYSSVWTGDNTANWEHLWLANIQCQRLSLSGVSFTGSDVGGFVGIPNGELYVRWMQLALFHPLFRTHFQGRLADEEADSEEEAGEKAGKPLVDREPWTFGKTYTQYCKSNIELRYQLLPYLYTAFWQYCTEGIPVIRPLILLDQRNEQFYRQTSGFGWGDHMLAFPVMQARQKKQTAYLPEGQWYHYWTGQQFEGEPAVTVKAPLDQVPLFVRAGAVIPHYPVMQYVGEKKIDKLTLHIYHKQGKEISFLYEDNATDNAYKKGKYSVKTFAVEGTSHQLIIRQTQNGMYQTEYQRYKMIVHGLPFRPEEAKADGKAIDINLRQSSSGNAQIEITLDKNYQELTINA